MTHTHTPYLLPIQSRPEDADTLYDYALGMREHVHTHTHEMYTLIIFVCNDGPRSPPRPLGSATTTPSCTGHQRPDDTITWTCARARARSRKYYVFTRARSALDNGTSHHSECVNVRVCRVLLCTASSHRIDSWSCSCASELLLLCDL